MKPPLSKLQHGEFTLHTFKDTIDEQVHFALVKGDLTQQPEPLVRVHLQNTFSDLLGSDRSVNRSFSIDDGLARIAKEGGVFVLLGKQEQTQDLINLVKRFEAEDSGENQAPAKWQGTSRNVGIGSQILAQLGISKMRLLSSPKNYHALSGFGLEVVEYVSD
jgi:3,4-dihydroxy 2-butanone 4-phosphate synthase / GTP cyclohydrolase II